MKLMKAFLLIIALGLIFCQNNPIIVENKEELDSLKLIIDSLQEEINISKNKIIVKGNSYLFGNTYDKYTKKLIPNVKIAFINENNDLQIIGYSDSIGHYCIYVPIGKYFITAEAEGYSTLEFSSSWDIYDKKVCNILLWPNDECKCKNGIIPNTNTYNPALQLDKAPTISISAKTDTVRVDSLFTFQLIGEDDKSVKNVFWWVEGNKKYSRLDSTFLYCNGNEYIDTISIFFHETGTYFIGANSRDDMYPYNFEAHQASEGEGMACLEVFVTE